jgi:hypothetical protein
MAFMRAFYGCMGWGKSKKLAAGDVRSSADFRRKLDLALTLDRQGRYIVLVKAYYV